MFLHNTIRVVRCVIYNISFPIFGFFQIMEDEKTLADYGLSSSMAKAQSPAEVGLSFMNDGTFEELEKTPYSSPPELPDVMKPGQETTAQEATTA